MAETGIAINIVNRSLTMLGHTPVSAISESAPASEHYPALRDYWLSAARWPFATTRRGLGKVGASPPSDFANYFALPTSPVVLRVLDIDRLGDYQLETLVDIADPTLQTSVLLSDADTIVLKYIFRADEARWSEVFKSLLAKALATEICLAVTGSESLRDRFADELETVSSTARLVSASQDTPRKARIDNSLLEARWRGVYPNYIVTP